MTRATAAALGLLVLLLAATLPLGTASAAATAATCSNVTQNNAGLGSRTWYVGYGSTAGTACSTGTDSLHDINSGESILLRCRESTTGSPPAQANTITIQGRADATDIGVVAGANIWTRTFSSCATEQTFTIYCTSDGTSSGAPRYGIVRLWLRAQRTDVPAYDTNADSSGTHGVFRCNPQLTCLTDGNPSTSPSIYVGGETYRTTMCLNAAPYNTGTNARLDLICDTSTQPVGTLELGTSASLLDRALKGDTATWPNSCMLRQVLTLTKTSSIPGLTGEPYAKWDTTSAPSDVTFSGQAAHRDTRQLDRTLTLASCTPSIGAETSISRAMPGELVSLTCSVHNARGEAVGNGLLATGYVRRTTPYATTDFPSTDFATTTGAAAWSTTARTHAMGGPATDTNGTSALDYVGEVKVFAGARTEAELVGWGTSAGALDVSTSFSLAIRTYRSTCSGSPSAVFFIAAHVLAQDEGPVRDARGNLVTRPLIFNRTWEEASLNGRIPASGYDSASGVITGTSPCHTIQPQAPESTSWKALATVVDGIGSSGSAEVTVSFLSPVTTSYQLSIVGAAVPGAPCRAMPLQVRVLKLNESSRILEPLAPDDPPYYWVNYTDASGTWQTAQAATTASPTGVSASAYHANWTVPCSWPATRPAVLHVAVNVSGLFISDRADLLVMEAAGDDPLSLSAADVDLGANWTVSVTARYDNLTARTGAASNITLRVRDPAGTWIWGGNPTEEIGPEGPEGYYSATGPALLEGTYEVRATVRTQLGELRNAPATSFRVLPRAASAASLDYYGNETLQRTNTTLGLLQGNVSTTVNATLVTLQDLDRDHIWLSDQHGAHDALLGAHDVAQQLAEVTAAEAHVEPPASATWLHPALPVGALATGGGLALAALVVLARAPPRAPGGRR